MPNFETVTAYLQQIYKRDTNVINALLQGCSSIKKRDIMHDVIYSIIGDPTDTGRCLTFNKRKKYIRCPNVARKNGLCSHHCRRIELDQITLRKRDRCIIGLIKEHGFVPCKKAINNVMACYRYDEKQHTPNQLAWYTKITNDNMWSWKHETNKMVKIECNAIKDHNNDDTKETSTSIIIANKSLHRLYGPPGHERCYCCNMTIESLNKAFKQRHSA